MVTHDQRDASGGPLIAIVRCFEHSETSARS